MSLDPLYLFNIEAITIELDKDKTQFRYMYYNNILFEKNKYIVDKFNIFTSIFQINIFSIYSQIFFDATYKSCPKKMYQLFNIVSYFDEIDGLIPFMVIPMSNKSERLSTIILNEVINILKTNKKDISKITKYFMSDFKVGLRNSIKNAFPHSILDGCFSHYTKLLWKHAK